MVVWHALFPSSLSKPGQPWAPLPARRPRLRLQSVTSEGSLPDTHRSQRFREKNHLFLGGPLAKTGGGLNTSSRSVRVET